MEENMKFFRTLTLAAAALVFAMCISASDTYGQRRYGGNYYGNQGYYGTQYGQRSWGGGYSRGWGGNRGSGLTWRQRQRLRMIRYRMMQRNNYRRSMYQQNYYRQNYYRRSGNYNYYPRNW
jgi:Spy/CpxP family protein refolding chaperone